MLCFHAIQCDYEPWWYSYSFPNPYLKEHEELLQQPTNAWMNKIKPKKKTETKESILIYLNDTIQEFKCMVVVSVACWACSSTHQILLQDILS